LPVVRAARQSLSRILLLNGWVCHNGFDTAQLPVGLLEGMQAESTDCCTRVPDTDGASCTSPPITAKANIAIAAIIM
jgi:hypothetical protein